MARIFVELSEGQEVESKFPLINEALAKVRILIEFLHFMQSFRQQRQCIPSVLTRWTSASTPIAIRLSCVTPPLKICLRSEDSLWR